MATQGINNLQVTAAKNFAGLTTDNHLNAIYQREPQMASDIVTQIFNQQNRVGLDTFLSKYPTKYFETDVDYRWFLKGDDEKAVMITGFSAADATRPGVAHQVFQLKVAENLFKESEYITFDDRDHGVRIMNAGVPDGTDWVYDVKHMRSGLSYFIPPALLATGRKVSRGWNVVTNTLNNQYGHTQYASHFEMRNVFSTHSIEYTVPGNVHNSPMIINMTTPDGESVKVWTRYQDILTEWQWRKNKARNLMYAQSNQETNGTYDMKSNNGFVIKQGAGLREQISPSYKFYYNTLTLDYIYEVCLNLSINILPEDDREFLLLTGERGMIQFHKLIEQNVALANPFGNPARLEGSGQSLGFRGQYIRFTGPQGIKMTVMHMPDYDDPIHNRLEDPAGGFTENYRYTIMNIGTTNGEPNIQKVSVRGREDLKAYVAGLTSPYGPMKGGLTSSDIDGYKIIYQTTHGIMLRNPLSAAELIRNVVYT